MYGGLEMRKILIIGLVLMMAIGLASAVPQSITHQGRLLQNGVLVDGAKTFNFKIYDSLSGGSLLWSTSNVTTQVRQGIYSVELSPIAASILSGGSAYLEITVDPLVSNDTLSPRTKLDSVGFAL